MKNNKRETGEISEGSTIPIRLGKRTPAEVIPVIEGLENRSRAICDAVYMVFCHLKLSEQELHRLVEEYYIPQELVTYKSRGRNVQKSTSQEETVSGPAEVQTFTSEEIIDQTSEEIRENTQDKIINNDTLEITKSEDEKYDQVLGEKSAEFKQSFKGMLNFVKNVRNE